MEKVSSLFRKDTIFFIDDDKEYTDKEVLHIIGKKLLDRGYVKESFGEALLEREANYPTGLAMMPYPVAIPHTDPGHVNEPCISIVRIKQGAVFHEMVNSESIVKVNFVFCIALQVADKQTGVLQYLMQVAGDDSIMNIIKNAKNADEIYKVVSIKK
ncbi:PTS sugar transporter subunit IIA [Clostridium sp. C105KSO13]|uniref:PTS sugar transporter subunit IIA n=1 Tax=Clostridium sp. C105KSO13 TaxID=1776045 RepID=UPI0007405F50|nr:PTS sugar transporter subunit IIA [Clostridium sp. C105KSO13]CUX38288.1 PTS system galactitol-specific transporter subunit IIA [Clostridium sp. C105KSO13]